MEDGYRPPPDGGGPACLQRYRSAARRDATQLRFNRTNLRVRGRRRVGCIGRIGRATASGSAAFASRYAFGDTPTRARKRRAKYPSSRKPTARAMSAMRRLVCASSDCASAIRRSVTRSVKVLPVSLRTRCAR
jgi:hypothetical protein